jgi:FMNH2-dependent dimethyl sulfone monooxygenase
VELREHDERYEYGSEWMEIVRRIWTSSEPFDFDGKYFQLTNVEGNPKPLQDPYPLIINAGNSRAGLAFAAREADINFAIVENLERGKANVEKARSTAEEHGRELLVLGTASVICRDSEDEAMSIVEMMREEGDREATRNILKEFGISSQSLGDDYTKLEDDWIVSSGANHLFGTPEYVAETIKELSDIGIDGLCMGSLDYYDELGIFNEKVMPLLVEMGLREEVRPLAS